jgi:glycosyltransferase involved in cell wall biosynthesis
MPTPLISVITINLNQAKGLQRTLQSLQAQRFNRFECIVVDGGSTDGSQNVIESFADTVSKSVSEPDEGIYHAMNKGWAMCSGTYGLIFFECRRQFARS